MSSKASILANMVGYQVAWFACVLGAAHGLWWLGPAVVLPLVVFHLRSTSHLQAELSLVLATAIVGSLFDQMLLSARWVSYPPSPLPLWLLPIWMSALWLSFATTLNVSLKWLQGKPLLAALFGAIGGPLAYGAGVKLGAMSWSPEHPVAAALCLGFAVVIPVLFRFSEWLGTKNCEGH